MAQLVVAFGVGWLARHVFTRDRPVTRNDDSTASTTVTATSDHRTAVETKEQEPVISKCELTNASPECEQETGRDFVKNEELQSKIVDSILDEEQKAMEFVDGELNMDMLNELSALSLPQFGVRSANVRPPKSIYPSYSSYPFPVCQSCPPIPPTPSSSFTQSSSQNIMSPSSSSSYTPTKSPPTKRNLFMTPRTDPITPMKRGKREKFKDALSPFDTLKKVRIRETQIGTFSPSKSKSGECQGMSSLWDDDEDDDAKRESPAQQIRLLFSPSELSDTKQGRTAAFNSLIDTECVDDAKREEDISQSPAQQLRLSFQSPLFSPSDTKKTRSAHIRGITAASSSPTDTERVRKHLFFDEPDEDEKHGEFERSQSQRGL